MAQVWTYSVVGIFSFFGAWRGSGPSWPWQTLRHRMVMATRPTSSRQPLLLLLLLLFDFIVTMLINDDSTTLPCAEQLILDHLLQLNEFIRSHIRSETITRERDVALLFLLAHSLLPLLVSLALLFTYIPGLPKAGLWPTYRRTDRQTEQLARPRSASVA